MAAEKNDDPIEAMLSSPTPGQEPPAEPPPAEEKPPTENPRREPRAAHSPPLRPPTNVQFEGRLEVRPIGTPLGLRANSHIVNASPAADSPPALLVYLLL